MASGDGNPIGVGPVQSTVIRLRKNTNNPAGNTFATYAQTLNATVSITNQQYNNHPQNTDNNLATANNPSTAIGWFFGDPAGVGLSDPIFPTMNLFGGAANANFTSSSQVAVGTGLDVAVNRAVNISTGIVVLNGSPVNGRYRMYDLVINFNRPVSNPIIHIAGLGGSFTATNGDVTGFTTEFDLLTPGLSLSRLSGTTTLVVPASQTQIFKQCSSA